MKKSFFRMQQPTLIQKTRKKSLHSHDSKKSPTFPLVILTPNPPPHIIPALILNPPLIITIILPIIVRIKARVAFNSGDSFLLPDTRMIWIEFVRAALQNGGFETAAFPKPLD